MYIPYMLTHFSSSSGLWCVCSCAPIPVDASGLWWFFWFIWVYHVDIFIFYVNAIHDPICSTKVHNYVVGSGVILSLSVFLYIRDIDIINSFDELVLKWIVGIKVWHIHCELFFTLFCFVACYGVASGGRGVGSQVFCSGKTSYIPFW